MTEAELTPIFHALSRWSADPTEFFRQDPLDAPLPPFASMARMLLHTVPAPAGPSAPHGVDRSGSGAPESLPAQRQADTAPRHASPAHHVAHGGRHRALRAVQHRSR